MTPHQSIFLNFQLREIQNNSFKNRKKSLSVDQLGVNFFLKSKLPHALIFLLRKKFTVEASLIQFNVSSRKDFYKIRKTPKKNCNSSRKMEIREEQSVLKKNKTF
jgi:hypothetical protein